jgi:hypothetical protein
MNKLSPLARAFARANQRKASFTQRKNKTPSDKKTTVTINGKTKRF